LMQLHNGAVHSGGQAEVIGVDNETAHGASVPTRGAAIV
jgi:hypothetical protein